MKCPKCELKLNFANIKDNAKNKNGIKCVKCDSILATWPQILKD